MIELELPWPPSVNHYWRSLAICGRAKVVLSRQGREYREAVARVVVGSGMNTLCGALSMLCIFYCPDWRERDIDNLHKGLLDSLVHAGAIEGDEFICSSISEKRHSADGIGRVVVQISRLDDGVIVKKSGAWLA